MDNEDDISAEEEIQSKGSWIQSKNEHTGRKKSIGCQKSKRQSEIISLMNQGHKKLWPFCFIY